MSDFDRVVNEKGSQMKSRSISIGFLAVSAIVLSGCASAAPQSEQIGEGGETLTIWWHKGIAAAEDEAAKQILEDWAAESGNSVSVNFIVNEDLPTKITGAEQGGNLPDLAFTSYGDAQLLPRLAADGSLADVTDVVDEIRDDLIPVSIESIPTGADGELLAVPIKLQSFHSYYRTDLTEEAGMPEEVPGDWEGFWDYFAEAQDNLAAEGKEVYATGLPASTTTDDADYVLIWLFNAFGAQLLNEEGEPQNTTAVRDAVAASFDFQKDLYDSGREPSAAISWGGVDNNNELERGSLIMTPNPGLSIPAGARTANPEYFDSLAIAPWPTSPSGDSIDVPVQVKTGVVFESSENQELAKDLLRYLTEPENLQVYMEAANGIYLPVNTTQWENPYWESDRFLTAAKAEILAGNAANWPFVVNPAFSEVLTQKVLTRALGEVMLGTKTSEVAAQEVLDQIESIVG